MTVQQFFDKYNNQGIDYDGYYGDQCVDLAQQYNQEVVGGPRLTGNAVDIFTTYPKDFYDKITNTPDGVPQEGDIMIWGTSIGQYGHIAVFKDGDQNQFTSFDQNWPANSVCHFQAHNYSGVLGWLHSITATPVQPINSGSVDNSGTAGVEFTPQTKIPVGIDSHGYDWGEMELQAVRGTLGDQKAQITILITTLDVVKTTPLQIFTSPKKGPITATGTSLGDLPISVTNTGNSSTTYTMTSNPNIGTSVSPSFFSQLWNALKSLFK